MGARQAADRGGERGPTNRRLPSAAPEKAPQWQTRRQGAHVGGGGGGKRGRREPCRDLRSIPALVGIRSALVKVGSGLPVCPLPPTRSERPPHGKGRTGGGRAKTVGAPGGPRAGNGPGLYFRERRGRGPTNPQSWFPRAGWVGPLALPCTTGPHPPEKRGFSHQFRVRFFPTHHHYRETKD